MNYTDEFWDIVESIADSPAFTQGASKFLASNTPGMYLTLSPKEKRDYIRAFNHYATPRMVESGER